MTPAVRFNELPAGHPGRRMLTGRTPSFVSQTDPRCSYSLFVPEDLRENEPPLALWVFVHGTGRRFEHYLDAFADLARLNRAVILAPLFPVGIFGPDDVNNYKEIERDGVRFDLVLLSMIDEVAHRWTVEPSAFFLHGFSGGGQFAHRFALLHPHKLSAVSIGAPGQITLPVEDQPWPRGVGDVTRRFDVVFDVESFAMVPTQVIVGDLDTDTSDLEAIAPGGDAIGRLTQAGMLSDAIRETGATVRFDVVEGVGHDGEAMIPMVREFLSDQLARVLS